MFYWTKGQTIYITRETKSEGVNVAPDTDVTWSLRDSEDDQVSSGTASVGSTTSRYIAAISTSSLTENAYYSVRFSATIDGTPYTAIVAEFVVQGPTEENSLLAQIAAQTASSVITPVLPLAIESEPLSVIRGNHYSTATLQPISFVATGIGEPESVTFLASVAGVNKVSIEATVEDVEGGKLITVPNLANTYIALLPSGALTQYQFLASYGEDELKRTIRWGQLHVLDVAVEPTLELP